MVGRRLWRNLDYPFIGSIIAILALSLVVLNSAAAGISADPDYYVKRQFLWIILGFGAMLAAIKVDYQVLRRYHLPIYLFNLALLVAVLLVGNEAKGAQRWIALGSFIFQPSEFAKISVIITLSRLLEARQGRLNNLKDLVMPFLHIALPMLLILVQPDLGTALVLMAILLGMLYLAGANTALLAKLIITGGVLVSFALFAHFHYGLPLPLKEYQLQRLVVFLNPYNDGEGGLGAGYHIIQSQIAIGSGGIWGKGLHQGSQVHLNFLPEHHTDFIFSVVGEELGFIRTLGVLGLYFILLYRTLHIAGRAKDMFGALLAGGVASLFAFHLLVNIGMTIGIMPVTGIPLPLFSYGGSAMLSNLLSLGLVLNVNLRRQKIPF
ncbi:MAG: rod shape determining protein RodA [Clostridia bacterium]|nr:rod shape determining protein RodA [Clostridia bacterium]